jgi:hypothetical protein
MADFVTFRETFPRTLPRWCRGERLGRLAYVIGFCADVIADSAKHALELRYPVLGSSALTDIGRERGLMRGQGEPEASYVSRLRAWRQTQRRKGTPDVLLEQLYAQFSWLHDDASFRIKIVPNTGMHVHTIDHTGTITYSTTSWNWDGVVQPWRWWLVLYVPALSNPVLGSGVWGSGFVWGGMNAYMTTSFLQRVQSLCQDWSSAHAMHVCTILVPSSAAFDSFTPNGSYNLWTSRNTTYRYI